MEKQAAACRAEWERRRRDTLAAWERERDTLHARLTGEARDLQRDVDAVRARLAEAAARLRAEEEGAADLRRQTVGEKGKLEDAAKLLAARRAAQRARATKAK